LKVILKVIDEESFDYFYNLKFKSGKCKMVFITVSSTVREYDACMHQISQVLKERSLQFNNLIEHNRLLPREKLQSEGVTALRTEELFSIILGSGSKQVPIQVLAQKISQKIQEKKNLKLEDLQRVKGIGVAKGCQILAAIELVERLRPIGYPLIDSTAKVLLQIGELRYSQREQLVCLYMNTRLQLLFKETLAMGSINTTALAPRDIFSVIKHHPVTNIILAHNHPSGDPTPSPEDKVFTRRIVEAGKLLGVEVLDHVIVGKEHHYSFQEQGVFQRLPP
jgi:DNA repair protein RadC